MRSKIGVLIAQVVMTHPKSFTNVVMMIPGAVPTSSTCLVGYATGCILRYSKNSTSSDPYVCAADFTATGQTITMQDGQATPVPWVVGGGVLGSSGSPAGWTWTAPTDAECRIFPGGVYLQANGSGATGSVIIKYGLNINVP